MLLKRALFEKSAFKNMYRNLSTHHNCISRDFWR